MTSTMTANLQNLTHTTVTRAGLSRPRLTSRRYARTRQRAFGVPVVFAGR